MKEAEALEFIGENSVRWRGRTLEYFSGCDYFRLARNPRVAAAALAALKASGLNVAASRFTTGNHPIYAQLETEIAKFFRAETAVLFPDGYFAPLAVAQAFAGEFTHAFIDELAHGALLDAARMLDCPLQKFKHRDAADLKKRLQKCGQKVRPIILTDGMFSHDGSAAPLRMYLKLLPASGMILVDDAHGAGVLGATGCGTLEFENVSRQRVVQCVTLSKAFGTYGGAVLATSGLREKILSRCRVFVGTTPLPPPLAGAALASLKLLCREVGRRGELFQNVLRLRAGLRAVGWDVTETPGPIVRLPVMNDTEARRLKRRLLRAGMYPPFLKYGATATGYFRFVISSQHTTVQLDKLIAVLAAFKNGG